MVFAMAAMVALASCSKTELVDNSAPTPISFKAVTGSVTKGAVEPGAVLSTAAFEYGLGVFASYNNINGNSTTVTPYFSDAYFEKTTVENKNDAGETISTTTTWNGDPERFWPIESSLNFIVYAPFVASGENNSTNSAASAEVSGTTLTVEIQDNTDYQYDHMYGYKYYPNCTKANTPETGIGVTLNHALALINIEFKGSSNVTVDAAKLTNVYMAGSYSVVYNTDGITTTTITSNDWDVTDITPQNFTIFSNNTTPLSSTTAKGATFMVVPVKNNNKISFTYKMKGMDSNAAAITKEIVINENWQPGTQYTYSINISSNEIKFNPSVTPWPQTINTPTTIK